MSFETLRSGAEMERFIKDASRKDSLWAPVLQFMFVNKYERVSSVRQIEDSLLYMPRGTMDPDCNDVKTDVANIALSRSDAIFGPHAIVNTDGIVLLNQVSLVKKPINRRSRMNWPNAIGEAIIPALVPTDNTNCSTIDKNPKLHTVQWLDPESTYRILYTDFVRSNMGKDAVSYICAKTLELAIPLIPEVAATA